MPASLFPQGFSQGAPEGSGDPALKTLPPPLRMLLVADGTVTSLLEALFWEPVAVHVLSQNVAVQNEDARALHREVVLSGRNTERIYAFAASDVQFDVIQESLREALLTGKKGIGELLREEALETHRKLLELSFGVAGELAPVLGVPMSADVVQRRYVIRHAQQQLMSIREVFPIALFRT